MMSDDMLSQDEIDALLRGTDDSESFEQSEQEENIEDYLSLMEQDALGEIGNISFGSSATALSTLLSQKVEITTPSVTIISKNRLVEEFPLPYVAVQVKYTEGFSGANLLVIKQADAAIIADLMLGGDGMNPPNLLDEIQLSAVQEAMNQMMGSSATSMSTIFNKRVDISPPSIDILDLQQGEGKDSIPNEDKLIKVSFRLKVGELIDSNIMQLLPVDFAKSLVSDLLNPSSQTANEEKTVETKAGGAEPLPPQNTVPQSDTANARAGEQQVNMQAAMPSAGNYSMNQGNWDQPTPPSHIPTPPPGSYSMPAQGAGHQSGPQYYGSPYPGGVQPNVQPAVFSEFEQFPLQESETKNLNMLLDIPLQVTVELGRTKRSVKEILELSSGSIIELDKLAGEPVDILVNNRLIAKGEVVVIDENFGVRVTDIISQSDRIKKLR